MKLELVTSTGVTVRRRLRGQLGADRAAATGAVFDDDRLRDPAGKILADRSRDRIHATGRGDRNDESDRARGEGVVARIRSEGQTSSRTRLPWPM